MTIDATVRVRSHIRVEGVVQGVGYRPFVHDLASGLGLDGIVGNDAGGVFIEAEGAQDVMAAFVAALRTRAPDLAVVESVVVESVAVENLAGRATPAAPAGFHIVASESAGPLRALVSPDSATCADCLAEVLDPSQRRFRYPFTNCTRCGPRLTIVTGLPYDRATTTMADFPMCEACAREYEDPADRRFHAQPVCCPRCGPALSLLSSSGDEIEGDALRTTAAMLVAGSVVAVKGLGGYHLAADATNEGAVGALRRRKHREDKPFAVLCADLETVRSLCVTDSRAEQVLSSRRRPIVLLPRRTGRRVAPSVAPGNRFLGVMLPYTPLHHLLARDVERPLVFTSGNVSDEPIAYRDDDALARLRGIADAFLTHDRRIQTRVDDSVVRLVRGRELLLRRSRGYAPEPLRLRWDLPGPVLGCGAELKSTFCLGRGRHAFVSHHIGDLENYETLRAFTAGVEQYRQIFEVAPRTVAHDLHPDYLSTKYAMDLAAGDQGVDLVGVQHHHAHIASCLADNGERGPVIGIALDGLGFGTDGTLWGGEVLIADLAGFVRAAHLEAVPMPGGAAAVREPWRMACAYLRAAYGDAPPAGLDVARRNASQWEPVLAMAARGVNAPLTSSAGRLFDAVAALTGVRDRVTYEGQAAIELEQRVDLTQSGGYPAEVGGAETLVVSGTDLVRGVVDDICRGTDLGVIGARFHNGLADVLARVASDVRERTGVEVVALSGGVFQNVILLTRLTRLLEEQRFRVLVHARIPPNDGGISLGQVAVAAARVQGST